MLWAICVGGDGGDGDAVSTADEADADASDDLGAAAVHDAADFLKMSMKA